MKFNRKLYTAMLILFAGIVMLFFDATRDMGGFMIAFGAVSSMFASGDSQ